ncbi:MAG: transcription termination factor Rho [Akkermansia sp.]|nr:transcription termination factor Rho [Akkermansia sp.]
MTPPDDTSAPSQQGKAHRVRRFSRRPQQQENRDSAPDSTGNFQRNNRNQRGNQSHHNQGNKNNHFNKRNNQHRPKEQGGNQREQNTGRAYVPVGEPEELTGILEITNKGYGFIRVPDNNWAPSDAAVYVSADVIAEHHLRPFVMVTGMAQKYERGHQLISVLKVNGETPEEAANHPHFEDLKAVNPTQRLSFATAANRYTTRTLDLVAPVARGQRGLIVAPPRTGKTTLLMHIAEGVRENYADDVHLMVLLVDERPEEVTEFRRSLPGAEIFASSNDSGVREHCRIAEMCIERAKRLVEAGKHVLILMDSITRLARAYNNAERGSGRTMSGGIDARALETPRRLFAAARSTRTAGSLTILATALIETNSRMDELIFQEFKGTGNMELVLNRRIAEMYIYPAVDILKSGTRREELILPEWMLEKVRLIRRGLAGYKPTEAMERLLFFLQRYKTNAQMLMDIKLRG